MKRLLSGIQSSGILNIGSYIGSIKQWEQLQNQYHCIFMIADLHALTVKHEPGVLQERCYDLLAWYLASSLDHKKNHFFIQSHVAEHAELGWILGCHTYMGELNRMTQFKEKSAKHQANINAGLFSYPALQAADILLYQTDLVPVGSDQKQHLELCRDIALRFNQQHGEVFKLPDPMISNTGHRIMNLQDPERKMSKSDPNVSGIIQLHDPANVITKKVKRAVTDSENIIAFNREKKPGLSNLLSLMSELKGQSIDAIVQEHGNNGGYGQFKQDVADTLIAYITPLQERYHEIRHDLPLLQNVLARGQEHASTLARETMLTIREKLGLVHGRYK